MDNRMYFDKHHLRNAIRTLKRYALVKIEEHYANSNEGCRKHLTTIERDMFGENYDNQN